MAVYRRLEVSEVDGATVVNFVDRKILDQGNIQDLGREMTQLVEQDQRRKILLNFANVDFLSSAALGKLIEMENKTKAAKGQLKLCNIRPEIKEVFRLTKLDQVFAIYDDESEALSAFS